MCECKKIVTEKMKELLKVEDGLLECELLSGKTYSNFRYGKRNNQGNLTKTKPILHSYCPFCGEKYEEEEE